MSSFAVVQCLEIFIRIFAGAVASGFARGAVEVKLAVFLGDVSSVASSFSLRDVLGTGVRHLFDCLRRLAGFFIRFAGTGNVD